MQEICALRNDKYNSLCTHTNAVFLAHLRYTQRCTQYMVCGACFENYRTQKFLIQGVLRISLPRLCLCYRETLLYLQPATRKKWQWGFTAIVQVEVCHVQCKSHEHWFI